MDLNPLPEGVARQEHAPRHPWSPMVNAGARDPGPTEVGTA
jgi:hypothetical protein